MAAAACSWPRRLLPHTLTPTRVAAYAFPLSTRSLQPRRDGERRMCARPASVRAKDHLIAAHGAARRSMQHHQHYLGPEEPGGPPPPAREKRPAESSGHDDQPPRTSRKMKDRQKPRPSGASASASISGVMQDFLEQQQRLDEQRQEAMVRHAQERLAFEQQWRQEMQRLERERLMLERAWMEREEQRRIRDEARAERRDALLNTLLNRLLRDDL